MSNDPLLRVEGLNAHYGRAHILHDVTLSVHSESVALIGRNGMGKTTLCNTLVGLHRATSGTVYLKGQPVQNVPSHQRARRGLGYVPQGRRIFRSLSVHEHLVMMRGQGQAEAGHTEWTLERIYELFPRLAERRRVRAGALSGGEQQMLAVGRALMLNAEIIIMDEPSEGLAPVIVDQLVETIQQLAAEGIALLVVEQKLAVATAVAERLLVMVNGEIVLETDSASFQADTAAQQRYLGVSPASN